MKNIIVIKLPDDMIKSNHIIQSVKCISEGFGGEVLDNPTIDIQSAVMIPREFFLYSKDNSFTKNVKKDIAVKMAVYAMEQGFINYITNEDEHFTEIRGLLNIINPNLFGGAE
jgi:hypothetical protein